MRLFKIYEVKNGYLLNPTEELSINRNEVKIMAKSRYDALVKYSNNATGKIYWKSNQPYYNPYYNTKFVAFLSK